MPFVLENWLPAYLSAVTSVFGDRIRFVGLQGSHRRGEATEESDIDLILILDTLSVADLSAYRTRVRTLPQGDRVCGFVSGLPELRRWPAIDLFQFVYETKPLYGSLEGELPSLSRQDVVQALHLGAATLYHAACHSFLFEDAAANLPSLCKQAWFLLQMLVFIRQGVYVSTASALLPLLEEPDAALLRLYQRRHTLFQLSAPKLEACYARLIEGSRRLLLAT